MNVTIIIIVIIILISSSTVITTTLAIDTIINDNGMIYRMIPRGRTMLCRRTVLRSSIAVSCRSYASSSRDQRAPHNNYYYISLSLYIYIYIHIHTYIYIYIYIYVYI